MGKPSRPLGAGLGTGTVCAEDNVAVPNTDAATINASAVRVPATGSDSVLGDVAILFNAQSWFDVRQPIATSVQCDIVFP